VTTTLTPANPVPNPSDAAPGPLASDHGSDEAQVASVAGNILAADQGPSEAREHSVGGEFSTDQEACANQGIYAELLFHAEMLTDLERLRIATENRVRSLGQVHGIESADYEQQAEALAKIEHQATLALQRALRRHPLGSWVKRTVGIGEKQGARLLAAIGDPCWNALEGRPRRGPAELWAYCGYAPGQKRTKGVKNNWNAQAKMRAYLIAESCIKQRHSPYRAVYDDARANWAGREGVTDGHAHNHALRLVAKAVLKDVFLEYRRVMGATSHRAMS